MENNDIIIPEDVQNIAQEEVVTAIDDTPKRRRRTKAEIQAAKEAEARALIADSDKQPDEEPEEEHESENKAVDLRDTSLAEAIFRIGLELRAPKLNKQSDTPGKSFPYRTVEDILAALKPIREKYGVGVDWNHDVVMRGTWVYNQITLRVWNIRGEERFYTALAREEQTRGDEYWAAQITGSCISYAVKYALQSAFSIDNTEINHVPDTDAMPVRSAAVKDAASSLQTISPDKPKLVKGTTLWYQVRSFAAQWKGSKEELESSMKSKYDISEENLALVCGCCPGIVRS